MNDDRGIWMTNGAGVGCIIGGVVNIIAIHPPTGWWGITVGLLILAFNWLWERDS